MHIGGTFNSTEMLKNESIHEIEATKEALGIESMEASKEKLSQHWEKRYLFIR